MSSYVLPLIVSAGAVLGLGGLFLAYVLGYRAGWHQGRLMQQEHERDLREKGAAWLAQLDKRRGRPS